MTISATDIAALRAAGERAALTRAHGVIKFYAGEESDDGNPHVDVLVRDIGGYDSIAIANTLAIATYLALAANLAVPLAEEVERTRETLIRLHTISGAFGDSANEAHQDGDSLVVKRVRDDVRVPAYTRDETPAISIIPTEMLYDLAKRFETVRMSHGVFHATGRTIYRARVGVGVEKAWGVGESTVNAAIALAIAALRARGL